MPDDTMTEPVAVSIFDRVAPALHPPIEGFTLRVRTGALRDSLLRGWLGESWRDHTRGVTRSRHRRYPASRHVFEAHDFLTVKPDSGVLPVSCWCERRIVAVSQTDVMIGNTESCGHPSCRPPAEAAEGW